MENDKRWCSECACALMMCSVDLEASRCSMEALRGTATIGVSREMDLQEMALGDEGQQQRDAFNKVTGCVGGTCYPVSENHLDLRRLPYRRKVLSPLEVEPPVVQHEYCPTMESDATDIGPNAAEDGEHRWKAEREREAEQEAKTALTCATRVQAARLALSGGRRRTADSRYLHCTVMQRTDLIRLRCTLNCGEGVKWLNRERTSSSFKQSSQGWDSSTVDSEPETVRNAAQAVLKALEHSQGFIGSEYWRRLDQYGQVHSRAYADPAAGIPGEDPPTPVQRLPRELRAILLDAFCMDLDMTNAHIAIVADILLQIDPLAKGSNYALFMELADPDRRESMLERVAIDCRLPQVSDDHSVRRSYVKELMLRFLYAEDDKVDQTFNSWRNKVTKELRLDDADQWRGTTAPASIRAFASQLHRARRQLLRYNPVVLQLAAYINSQREPIRRKPVVAVAFATLIMSVEHQLLADCATIIAGEGFEVMDLIFDGLHVLIPAGTGGSSSRTEEGREAVKKVAITATERIKCAWGFTLFKLRAKEFTIPNEGVPVSTVTDDDRAAAIDDSRRISAQSGGIFSPQLREGCAAVLGYAKAGGWSGAVPLQHVTVPAQQSALSRFDPERIATTTTETGHVSLLREASESVEGGADEERNRTYPWHHAAEWDSTSLARIQLDVDLPGAGDTEANDIFGVLSATQDNLVMAVRPDGLVLDARDLRSIFGSDHLNDKAVEAGITAIGESQAAWLSSSGQAAIIGGEGSRGMPKPVGPSFVRWLLDNTNSDKSPARLAAVVAAAADRLIYHALRSATSNEATVAIVNTGHKHWIALRSSARRRTIEVYCPLQSGNRYPRIAMLWASVQARLNAGDSFNIHYIEGKSKQVDSCNCALLCLQTVQCWMRHAEPNFDAQVGSSTRRARLAAALVLSSKSVHEPLGHVVRAEELTETESNIARSIRPLVFTGGNAADEAADIHSDEDEEATGSDDISGPQLDHERATRAGGERAHVMHLLRAE